MLGFGRPSVAAAAACLTALTWSVPAGANSPPALRRPAPQAHIPSPTGPPYPVHELAVPVVDPSRPTISRGIELSGTRALTTLVWIPVTSRPRPLILFAPGFSVGPPPYEPLLLTWARQGYVVAAIEFPLTDAAVAGVSLDEGDLQNQPQDVDVVLHTLLSPDSPVRRFINPREVALAGHSDGGETVLVASFRNGAPGTPSVQAVIAMSVRPLNAAVSATNPPILVTQGDVDAVNVSTNGAQVYAAAAPPKYLAVLNGGGHLEPLESGSEWFPALANVTTAFLDLYLNGRGSPSTILAAGNQGFLSTMDVLSP